MAVGNPILVILGPTASGKSALALEVARRLRGEILSVDSMQVYRGMDIGTAKPTPQEKAQVRHHLIDLVNPDEIFTVARFVEQADRVIAGANVPVIATGGTPLYYKALFEGLFEGPPADESVRQRLRGLAPQELTNRLAKVDPAALQRIHANDSKRLVRALEIYELTGRPISSFQTDWAAGRFRHDAIWIGLHWEREELNRGVNARVKQMIAAGWLQETQQLLETYGGLSRTAQEATGYDELMQHLAGRMTLDEAVERIKISTRQLARRQMKWLRRWKQVRWIEGNRPIEELTRDVLEHWKQASP